MTEARAPRIFLQPYEAKKMTGWLHSLGPDFKPAANALIGYAAVGMTPNATAAWEALRSKLNGSLRATPQTFVTVRRRDAAIPTERDCR